MFHGKLERVLEDLFVPTVGEVMSSPVVTIRPTASVMEAVEVMAERHVGSLVVVIDSEPKGIFTEHDLMNRVLKNGLPPAETKVGTVMSAPLVILRTSDSITRAIERMREEKINHLVAFKREQLVGILTMTDIRLRFRRGYWSPRLLIQKFAVDTAAYIAFWSGITFIIQVVIVGLTWGQFIASSTLGFIVTLILGGPYGRFLDIIRQRFEV